jgi:hypothetical protein
MRDFFHRVGEFLSNAAKKVTYAISKGVTATVITLGALAGIANVRGEFTIYRPGIAIMIFFVGLPLGLILLGSSFSTIAWLGIVVTILFLMNLHNVWEVVISLKYGGLDWVMATQAVAAARSVTPDREDMEELNQLVKNLNVAIRENALRPPIYNDGIIKDKQRKRLKPCADPLD